MTNQPRPLHGLFGKELPVADLASSDVDLTKTVEAAIGEAGLLLFRNVRLEDSSLAAFAGGFGSLESLSGDPEERMEVGRVTNLDAEGQLLPATHEMHLHTRANELWHIDSTFRAPGARYSFLYARVVTSDGGQTEFCDARATWDALPQDRKDQLADLTADHSVIHSRSLIGFDMGEVSRRQLPSIRRKLVRRHEPSGRDALLVASHIERIGGLDLAASRALVEELTAIATGPERVYRHEWRVGDLLMWDNRCTMHRALPYPYRAQPRDMRSCRTNDEGDSGLAADVG